MLIQTFILDNERMIAVRSTSHHQIIELPRTLMLLFRGSSVAPENLLHYLLVAPLGFELGGATEELYMSIIILAESIVIVLSNAKA